VILFVTGRRCSVQRFRDLQRCRCVCLTAPAAPRGHLHITPEPHVFCSVLLSMRRPPFTPRKRFAGLWCCDGSFTRLQSGTGHILHNVPQIPPPSLHFRNIRARYIANIAGVVFYCREKAVSMSIPLLSAALGWILCWLVILFWLPERDKRKLQERADLQSRML
jgi:hypothetical protein